MKNVWMLCAAGVSTHLFAEKVQAVLDADGFEASVVAKPVSEAKEHGGDADLILLTPQVSFEADLIRALFPNERIEVIDFEVFAAADAEAEAAHIKDVLGA